MGQYCSYYINRFDHERANMRTCKYVFAYVSAACCNAMQTMRPFAHTYTHTHINALANIALTRIYAACIRYHACASLMHIMLEGFRLQDTPEVIIMSVDRIASCKPPPQSERERERVTERASHDVMGSSIVHMFAHTCAFMSMQY